MSVHTLLNLCPTKKNQQVDKAVHTTGDCDASLNEDMGLLQYCTYLSSVYGCVYM